MILEKTLNVILFVLVTVANISSVYYCVTWKHCMNLFLLITPLPLEIILKTILKLGVVMSAYRSIIHRINS